MGKDRPKKPEPQPEEAKGKGKGKEPEVAAKGVQAMEIRHILVEKQKLSLEVLEMIALGKKTFNEAARDHSIDKAGRSGLLGWKRREELDPILYARCCRRNSLGGILTLSMARGRAKMSARTRLAILMRVCRV
jgi:hypothetical protein